jgi:hypothetical protein
MGEGLPWGTYGIVVVDVCLVGLRGIARIARDLQLVTEWKYIGHSFIAEM